MLYIRFYKFAITDDCQPSLVFVYNSRGNQSNLHALITY